MSVYKQKHSKYWWYKFYWEGNLIRQSTGITNRKEAVKLEAAHRTQLARKERGIEDKPPVCTLREFAEQDFLPHVRATSSAKLKTLKFYENGVKRLLAHPDLAELRLDEITTKSISGFAQARQKAGLQVSSINRELQVLRRMFALASEWSKSERILPKVKMLPGERHRERVLTPMEEADYLAYAAPLLHDVAVILLDCGMRPEECFRLRWENVLPGELEILHGKTDNARRRIALSARALAVLAFRRGTAASEWVFPAQTRSGHIEPASVKRQHLKACQGPQDPAQKAKGKMTYRVALFPLYTMRHTCLTRWAPHMDPWTLAYLAGHRDMSITKRYVHPQMATIKAALENARGLATGHRTGIQGQDESSGQAGLTN